MPKRKKTPLKHASRVQSAYAIASAQQLRILAGTALIVVIVFLAYLSSISGDFILDDDVLLTENPLVKAPDGPYRFWCSTEAMDYWPVTNTILWIEWRLWGMHSTGYHITNLILHVVESLLVWVVLRNLSIPGAFFAALIFAVHPVNVESVAWISSRKNLMAMLFFLPSILWYFMARMPRARAETAAVRSHGGPWERERADTAAVCSHGGPWERVSMEIPSPVAPCHSTLWYWLSLAAFTLAMLSKGSAAVLPVLLLLIAWWLRSTASVPTPVSAKTGLSTYLRRDLLRTVPFFLIALALAAINVWFQKHGTEVVGRTAGFVERLLGAGGVVWFYLFKASLPFDLAFIYPRWNIEAGNPLWWLPLTAALFVTAVLWLYGKTWSRPILFAWGFFCAALVPVMGFIDVGFMQYSLVADHYQHIAIIGVIALASVGWSEWHRLMRIGARWTTAVAVLIVVSFTLLTYQQNGIYRDDISLYKAALAKNPSCSIAHNNLGFALYNLGRPLEAIEYYGQALALDPKYAQAKNNLGVALVRIGRLQDGIDQFEQVLRFKPNDRDAHDNLGSVLLDVGRVGDSIYHCKQALLQKPNDPAAQYNLGNALIKTGSLKEAIMHYEQALRANPDYPQVHNNLAGALIMAGRLQEGIEHLKQALRLMPEDINSWHNLAKVHAMNHQSSEAIAAARKALELARSRGRTEQAQQIENWLNSYRASLSEPPK